MTLAEPAFLTLVGALGASLGSFVNVVAWRLPLGRSLTRPASSCPACGHPVRWRDNVPVLGWFMLGGRCRDCRVAISLRYPLVELAGALLAVALWLLHSGPQVMPARLEQLLPTVVVPLWTCRRFFGHASGGYTCVVIKLFFYFHHSCA